MSRDNKEGKNIFNVGKIFSEVASKYDIMNDIMSIGLHRLWKKNLAKRIVDTSVIDANVLDVACGTADIPIELLKLSTNIDIVMCDPNMDMLSCGLNKLIDLGTLGVKTVCCSAEELPFMDDFFDVCTIVFGIRNFADREKSLREVSRVLRRGGKMFCMEFTNPASVDTVFSLPYEIYLNKIIPAIGSVVAHNRDAYSYLAQSIEKFPKVHEFENLIRSCGFNYVKTESIFVGIVSLYIASVKI